MKPNKRGQCHGRSLRSRRYRGLIGLRGDSIPIRRLFQLHLSFAKIVSSVLPIGILSPIVSFNDDYC